MRENAAKSGFSLKTELIFFRKNQMRKNAKVSPEMRAQLWEALEILKPTNFSLVEAAKIAAAMGNRDPVQEVRGWSVEETIDHFLKYMRNRLAEESCSEKTYAYYDEHLWFWSDQVDAEQPVTSIDRAMLRESLDGIPRSDTSIQTTWRAVRRLFRWAAKLENPPVLLVDPSRDVELDARNSPPKRQFWPVELIEKLFADPGKYFYTYVCMFFAGIRPYEVRGAGKKPPLRFEHIAYRQFVRIPSEISKTGRIRGSRIINAPDLPEAFWRLWEGAPTEGVICPHSIVAAQEHGKKVMGLDRWPHDIARHSFATYDIAARSDPAKTVLCLGHDEKPTMCNRHYRGNEIEWEGKVYVATRERGERFMAIPKSV
jgi:integrase